MGKKHENVCRALNYIKHFLILISTVRRCFSISSFAYLVGIIIVLTNYAVGLKICVITASIKKYKSLIKKKKKKHNRTILLVEFKLNSTKVLSSKALVDSNIN